MIKGGWLKGFNLVPPGCSITPPISYTHTPHWFICDRKSCHKLMSGAPMVLKASQVFKANTAAAAAVKTTSQTRFLDIDIRVFWAPMKKSRQVLITDLRGKR